MRQTSDTWDVRRQTDRRQTKASLNASALWGRGIINQSLYMHHSPQCHISLRKLSIFYPVASPLKHFLNSFYIRRQGHVAHDMRRAASRNTWSWLAKRVGELHHRYRWVGYAVGYQPRHDVNIISFITGQLLCSIHTILQHAQNIR